MDPGIAAVIAAVVAVLGGLVINFLQIRKESRHSRREHAFNLGVLNAFLPEIRELRKDVKQDFVVVRTEIKGVVEQISEQIAEHTKINH